MITYNFIQISFTKNKHINLFGQARAYTKNSVTLAVRFSLSRWTSQRFLAIVSRTSWHCIFSFPVIVELCTLVFLTKTTHSPTHPGSDHWFWHSIRMGYKLCVRASGFLKQLFTSSLPLRDQSKHLPIPRSFCLQVTRTAILNHCSMFRLVHNDDRFYEMN